MLSTAVNDPMPAAEPAGNRIRPSGMPVACAPDAPAGLQNPKILL